MPTTPSDPTELAEFASPHAYPETVARLVAAIEASGARVMARIDHAAGAQAVGLAMPPTLVMLYGNPRGGTPIMLDCPAAALDLPLRVLVRQDAAGATWVAFHPIAPLLARSGVGPAAAARLEPAQRLLVEALKA